MIKVSTLRSLHLGWIMGILGPINIFNSPLHLLRFVLKYLAWLNSDAHHVCIYRQTERSHIGLWEVKNAMSGQVTALEEMHFVTAGAFPWCEDWSNILWVFIQSGDLIPLEDVYIVKWFQDSEDLICEQLAELSEVERELLDSIAKAVIDHMVAPSPISGHPQLSFPLGK